MFEQQSLEGFEPGGRLKRQAARARAPEFGADEHGFFLAVRPDAPAQAQLMRLAALERGAHRLKGRPRPGELLHVTLLPLGRYASPDEDADRRLDTVKAVCANLVHARFDVRLDRVLTFNGGHGKHAIVAAGGAGVADLMAFREELRLALADGAPRSADGYTPHVTLLYDQAEVEEHAVAPISWTVRGFALIHSDIGKSRHTVLADWALAGGSR
jgi:2'-5' RNA ligase